MKKPSGNMMTMFRQDYAQLSIFAGLDDRQLKQLSPFLIEVQFGQDEVVFEQGQPAQFLYILLSGEVVINYKPYDGPQLTVARIEPGGVFGWSAALGRDIYTSGALAALPSATCCIRGAHLSVIRERHPEMGNILLERLASVIAQRLASTHTHVLGILTKGVGCK
jgi:CRP/FNR family transcriptional regulator, cyclic AMP receptor protein